MLTGKMVRVRFGRKNLEPYYLDINDPQWLLLAERLIDLFRAQAGQTRGELEETQREAIGDDPGQLVHQGLLKLLEDRCEFTVVSGHPPEQLRELVFQRAALARLADGPFDRNAVLQGIGTELGLDAAIIEEGMFADLKSEQRLATFKDTTPERLLHRYNVALAQALVMRAVRLRVIVRKEKPARYRQLLRQAKFHRLICDFEPGEPDEQILILDGPLSLFSATQKYGLQLALWLPTLLLCRDFELTADVLWGPQKRPRTFVLTPKDNLVSHAADKGAWTPPELRMFVELFRKRIDTWDLSEETEIYPLGRGSWVPDFRLTHRTSGRVVLLEVLGFWRKASAEKHLALLREHARLPFLLAVSDGLHIDDADLEGALAGVHRFRNMPLPDEIARLADDIAERK